MSVEPVDEDAGGETEGDRGDGQDPEDGGHRGGLPAVVGGLGAAPPEGEEPEPGGVGGGEDRGGESGDEDQPAGRGRGDVAVAEGGVLGGDEDGFLGEEAGERGMAASARSATVIVQKASGMRLVSPLMRDMAASELVPAAWMTTPAERNRTALNAPCERRWKTAAPRSPTARAPDM